MQVIYLHHSGFALVHENIVIVIDYWSDTDADLGALHDLLKKDFNFYFLSSHFHEDHFNSDIFTLGKNKNSKYVLSRDIWQNRKNQIDSEADITYLKPNESFSDDTLKIDAFGSTDEGISFVINIAGLTIYHAGDLNNWNWILESTESEIRTANIEYLRELNIIKGKYDSFDIAMVPVDPRMKQDFYLGAMQLASNFKIDYFIPMHFWDDYESANNSATDLLKYVNHFMPIYKRGESFFFNFDKK